MLVGRRTSADCGGRCPACALDAQRRRVLEADIAFRRRADYRDHPVVRLLPHGVIPGERARPAARGKSGEISGVESLWRHLLFFFTSPRLRGEVVSRRQIAMRVRGTHNGFSKSIEPLTPTLSP